MRNNRPISATDYVLQDGEKRVSTSDTAGCISYAHRGFIEISGYSEDELIGQPHNIIRHPDMPCAAFADLRRTSPQTARERALNRPSLGSATLMDGARPAGKPMSAADGNTHTRRPQ